jgi:hypothetical protein
MGRMPGWIYVIAIIVIVAVVAYVAMRSRSATVAPTEADTSARDYSEERESSRLDHMSAEDRAWETASRERSRNAQQEGQPPTNDG